VPVFGAVALRPMLSELAESFEPLAAEKGLRLVLAVGHATAHSDSTLLRSIVQNFLSNAIRYTDKGGVLLAVRRRGEAIRIEIYDSGRGIAPDQQQIIFREFERLTGSGDVGIGLGLAIVERSAKLLNAQIEVRSRPGRGSRFTVIIPASVESGGEAVTPRASPAVAAPSRNILVVDDDPDICDAMAALLSSLGHRVMTASSPQDALAHAGPFDAALVDFHLGSNRNGIDVITSLRGRHPHVRTALITAERSPAMQKRAAALHIAVLTKPLHSAALEDWLAQD
jgi:CheY-like chemotaxis protein/anti-sigma regulatory factor (Ser/Thr protein kinase)